jgi:hypothetical protein
MTAAFTSSRRKMFWKVRVTVEVPAPLEPVMAMMGWRSDMKFSKVKNHPRAAFGVTPFRGQHQPSGKAGPAVFWSRHLARRGSVSKRVCPGFKP